MVRRRQTDQKTVVYMHTDGSLQAETTQTKNAVLCRDMTELQLSDNETKVLLATIRHRDQSFRLPRASTPYRAATLLPIDKNSMESRNDFTDVCTQFHCCHQHRKHLQLRRLKCGLSHETKQNRGQGTMSGHCLWSYVRSEYRPTQSEAVEKTPGNRSNKNRRQIQNQVFRTHEHLPLPRYSCPKHVHPASSRFTVAYPRELLSARQVVIKPYRKNLPYGRSHYDTPPTPDGRQPKYHCLWTEA